MSQQKEFRAIHNAVIQAALRMERITFEDRSMEQHDEPDDILRNSKTCEQLWTVIRDDSFPLDLRDKAVERIRTQAEDGIPMPRSCWSARTIDSTQGQYTGRKLRRRIQEKKIAMGHKPDDHEEQSWGGVTMWPCAKSAPQKTRKGHVHCAKCFVRAAVFLRVMIWTSPQCFGIVLLANGT